MSKTNGQLRQLLHSILDCQTHFHAPTIINNDDYFSFGERPIVICTLCVERIENTLGLNPGERPSPLAFKDREHESKFKTKQS